MERSGWIALALGGLVVAAAPALAADQSVTVSSNSFTPRDVVIDPGDTVTWNNTGGRHNVSFQDGSYTQPPIPQDAPWTVNRTFSTAGTFSYVCQNHGSMTGTVYVGTTPPSGGDGTAPGGSLPGTGSPGSLPAMTVTMRVSDTTPTRGQRVRFRGSVRPQHDGRVVYIERRGSGGRYRRVASTRLRDAGSTRSRYSRRVRIWRSGVYRARVPGDRDHRTGTSRRRSIRVG